MSEAQGSAIGGSSNLWGLEDFGEEGVRVGEVGNGGSWDRQLNCLPDLTWPCNAAWEAEAAARRLAALASQMIDLGLSTNGTLISCAFLQVVIQLLT